MNSKHAILFFFVLISIGTHGQEVFINGTQGNRRLTWEDFAGQVDKRSAFAAFTWWDMNYRYSSVQFNGDTAILMGLMIKLEFNSNRSWIKKGKESDNLLIHEQGHFDIGLLCLLDLMRTFDSTIFFRSDFATKPGLLFRTSLEKYQALSLKYDAETDHSKNQRRQIKWDLFLNNELQRSVQK